MADWHRIKLIFEEVIELPATQRAASLDALCGDDATLRAGVERLLASHDAAGEFLGAPTLDQGESGAAATMPADGSHVLPKRIGAYTPLEVIGEGGFGTVYKAQQDVPVRRVVALKVIKLGMDTREVIARFEGERQALAMMSHPNIAAVLDAGATAAGRPYFVMEFVPGEPITTYCDRNALSLPQRLELFGQVCHAVQHAHQKGIIHRDIKPSNVLVIPAEDNGSRTGTNHAVVKVIDFGVAKATEQRLTQHSIMTLDGMLVGTPEYMSPEQADPGEQDIDTRTDIYSLGVLLYELVTGTMPFGRNTLRRKQFAEIQRIVREVDPPRPSQRLGTLLRRAASATDAPPNDDVPAASNSDAESLDAIARLRGTDSRQLVRRVRGELDWIIMRCLEKDRSRRYDTANTVAQEIERYLKHEPILAGPPGTAYRLSKFVRRYRVIAAASGAVLIAIVAGLIVATVGFRAAVKARDTAEQQRRLAQRSEEAATRSARKAAAVNAFLQQMLAEADPRTSAKRDMTVRSALNRAVRRLDDGEMRDEPEIEAEIRLTIGRSYTGLAQFDAAQTQISAAVDGCRALFGDASKEYAAALHERGAAFKLAGQPVEAEQALRSALGIFEALGAASADAAAACANDLALALIDQQRYDDAAPILASVYDYATKPENSEKTLLPEAVNNMGSLHMAQQQFDKAAPFFREAIAINTQRHGDVHPVTATNHDNLAQALQGSGDLDGALASFQMALSMRRALFGNDHPDLATTLHNLAVLHYVRQEFPECEKALRESRDVFIRAHGLAHADTLTVNDSLVSVFGGLGRLDDAEALLLEAFEAIRDAPEIDAARKKAVAERLNQLYTAMNRPEDAAAWRQTADKLAGSAESIANEASR